MPKEQRLELSVFQIQRPSDGHSGYGVILESGDRYKPVGLHLILSPEVNERSIITWAGHLRCFPAETSRNMQAKLRLMEERDPESYYVAVENGEFSHLAPIAITINEARGEPYLIGTGCCVDFARLKRRLERRGLSVI